MEGMLIVFFIYWFYSRSKPLIMRIWLSHPPGILLSIAGSSCIVSMIWSTWLPPKAIFTFVARSVNIFKWKYFLTGTFLSDFFSCWSWHLSEFIEGIILIQTLLLFSSLCISGFHWLCGFLLVVSYCWFQLVVNRFCLFKPSFVFSQVARVAKALNFLFFQVFIEWGKNLRFMFLVLL